MFYRVWRLRIRILGAHVIRRILQFVLAVTALAGALVALACVEHNLSWLNSVTLNTRLSSGYWAVPVRVAGMRAELVSTPPKMSVITEKFVSIAAKTSELRLWDTNLKVGHDLSIGCLQVKKAAARIRKADHAEVELATEEMVPRPDVPGKRAERSKT